MTDEPTESPFRKPTTRAKARELADRMNRSELGGYYYPAPVFGGWIVKVIA